LGFQRNLRQKTWTRYADWLSREYFLRDKLNLILLERGVVMTQQSEDMLKRHLEEHIGFLKRSAELYDKGVVEEAKRLAVSIRVLLYDPIKPGRSKSLLGQLGMKESRQFIDTARPRSHASSHAALVSTLLTAGPAEYSPLLSEMGSKLVPFEQWWTATVIIDSNQRELSRQQLVLTVANQDGGAHVDAKLDDTYADLSLNNSMGQMYLSSGLWQPIDGVELASIRQIAHEVLCTFDPVYSPRKVNQKSGIKMLGIKLHLSSQGEKALRAKMGRNSKCYCGSGKKYKRCHGVS
jgi:hypothetical protein